MGEEILAIVADDAIGIIGELLNEFRVILASDVFLPLFKLKNNCEDISVVLLGRYCSDKKT